jgi:hypothetical protein
MRVNVELSQDATGVLEHLSTPVCEGTNRFRQSFLLPDEGFPADIIQATEAFNEQFPQLCATAGIPDDHSIDVTVVPRSAFGLGLRKIVADFLA